MELEGRHQENWIQLAPLESLLLVRIVYWTCASDGLALHRDKQRRALGPGSMGKRGAGGVEGEGQASSSCRKQPANVQMSILHRQLQLCVVSEEYATRT